MIKFNNTSCQVRNYFSRPSGFITTKSWKTILQARNLWRKAKAKSALLLSWKRGMKLPPRVLLKKNFHLRSNTQTSSTVNFCKVTILRRTWPARMILKMVTTSTLTRVSSKLCQAWLRQLLSSKWKTMARSQQAPTSSKYRQLLKVLANHWTTEHTKLQVCLPAMPSTYCQHREWLCC